MTTSGPPAGWHPDPANPGASLRWWDGTRWTDQTQPAGPAFAPAPGPGTPATWTPGPGTWPAGPGRPGSAAGWSTGAPAQTSRRGAGRRNEMALTGLGFSAVYLALAVSVHFYLIGIVPILMAVRSFQRREPLAPVAAVAAAAVLVVTVVAYAHR